MGAYFWYDNLSRDLILSGKLEQLIKSGISGVTTNPNIFKNALSTGSSYSLTGLGSETSAEAICWNLMLEDVRLASKLFEPLFINSNGLTGYVSIELDPFLAKDTKLSIEQALNITSKLQARNVMIKVPATEAGLEVIESLIYQGVNVNVTLIFSREQYLRVVNSYIKGLERRVSEGRDISQIASVASFFVSRVDSIVSKYISQNLVPEKFVNLLGIYNSFLVYYDFQRIFSSERFKKLQILGGKPQMLLWASTGVKDSRLSQDYYLKNLTLENTVLTLPDPVIQAGLDLGWFSNPTFRSPPDINEIYSMFQDFNSCGYPFEALMYDLLEEGIKLFQEGYTDLINIIRSKFV